jgi:hypothetical protein
MNAKPSRRTTVIMVGVIGAVVLATHVIGSLVRDAGTRLAIVQTAAAQKGTAVHGLPGLGIHRLLSAVKSQTGPPTKATAAITHRKK